MIEVRVFKDGFTAMKRRYDTNEEAAKVVDQMIRDGKAVSVRFVAEEEGTAWPVPEGDDEHGD